MVRDGYFYALACFAVGALLYVLTHWLIFPAVLLLLACFFLWFFRDPERAIPEGPGLVVSPADGKVTSIEEVETPAGRRKRMSIFLNVFNVHVNRVPIGGQVSEVTYSKGLYLNAMNPDSAVQNERNLVAITSPEGYAVSFTQIAGLLARRIVCGVKPGDLVRRGQRMGLIKFGSRVDVVMPAEAEIVVRVGQTVSGGDTVLARLPGVSSMAAGAVGEAR